MDKNRVASQMRWSFSPVYAGHGDHLPEGYQSYSTGDAETQALLEKAGMDSTLSEFFSHMLKYDHLILDPKHLEPESPQDTYHFRALIGSLWPDIRFKPPPDGSDIGWRVEFRPMEVQITDFENAAFVVFMALMRRAISHFDLNLYLPMELVGENMCRSVMRDAVNRNQFWFRESVSRDSRESSPSSSMSGSESDFAQGYREMSLREIVCGSDHSLKGSPFPGLVPLIHSLLDAAKLDSETRKVLNGYLTFVAKRASGELWTPAKWMRHFIQTHEKYQGDSVVSEEICYDLVCAIEDLTRHDLL
jgi:glutamate--cysteine ligase catalytic subunit